MFQYTESANKKGLKSSTKNLKSVNHWKHVITGLYLNKFDSFLLKHDFHQNVSQTKKKSNETKS